MDKQQLVIRHIQLVNNHKPITICTWYQMKITFMCMENINIFYLFVEGKLACV